MRYVFKFPDIGEGISEGVIIKWHVEKGQEIKAGANLVQMETDKVVADIPSPRGGVVAARFGSPGDTVKVGDALVEIDIEGLSGEDAQAAAREKPAPPRPSPVKEESFGIVGVLEEAGDGAYLPAGVEGLPAGIPPKAAPRVGRALATPVARAYARNLGLDINQVPGTGPGGRVTKKDIESHARTSADAPVSAALQGQMPADPGVEYVPLTQLRKTIAHRMTLSLQNAAHAAVFDEVEASSLVELRNSQKDRLAADGVKLTYMAFIVKAVALSLKAHRIFNSRLEMDRSRIVINNRINIGLAVDTPEGLIVPVIHDAGGLTIREIAARIMSLSERARERKLTVDELKGGTFSITNYGAIGGIFGMPIINYPEVAILGVGRLRQAPVVKDGLLTAGWLLPLSLAGDHRVVDGADAARFLGRVMQYLSDPVSMLLG
jgi:pyruvate dehydrogenase E2 component (dihydrolipoamide acetyltransferase)